MTRVIYCKTILAPAITIRLTLDRLFSGTIARTKGITTVYEYLVTSGDQQSHVELSYLFQLFQSLITKNILCDVAPTLSLAK